MVTRCTRYRIPTFLPIGSSRRRFTGKAFRPPRGTVLGEFPDRRVGEDLDVPPQGIGVDPFRPGCELQRVPNPDDLDAVPCGKPCSAVVVGDEEAANAATNNNRECLGLAGAGGVCR
jgi:hypothetical protein